MKKRYKRFMAAGTAAVMLCTGTGGGAPAYGAPASVDIDETMYVNLDYYGGIDKVNVVKAAGLNGCGEFTDYGVYDHVINMTNSAQPVLGEGTVTWNLPDTQKERFYFKCGLDKGQVTLPWDFDVSYKLNGVPADGGDLAGASGLIEIHVKADPNDKAREYYRNNLMLMVAVPVDMSKCYSVEAEGSQTQNLGETTAVVFTALPGEEGDYRVRIGTDSFESIGVIMAMVPGTVEDLEHIKDLKEAKDTWQDAGDELYDSLEQMAKSAESMRKGVNQVRGGMDSAESARQKWSSSKDGILAGNDQTLASLSSVSRQLETMIPHLQTAKDSAEVVHQSMGDIVNTMGEMQDPLRKLQTRLNNIKSSSGGLAENIPELTQLMQELIALDAQLQASEQAYVTQLGIAAGSISLLDEDYLMDEEELEEMQKSSSGSNGLTGSLNAGTGQSGAGQTGNGQTGTEQAGNGQTGTGQTGSGQTGTGQTGSGQTGTGQTGSGQTGSGQTGTADGEAGQGGSGGSPEGAGEGQKPDGETPEGTGEGQNPGGEGQEGTGEGQNSGGEGQEGAGGTQGGTPGSQGGTEGNQNAGGGAEGNQNAGGGAEGTQGGSSQTTDTAQNNTQASAGPKTSVLASIEKHEVPLVSVNSIPGVTVDSNGLMQLLSDKKANLSKFAASSSELAALMSNLMDDTSDAAKYSAEIVDNLDYLIEDITALHDSLDMYYPDLQAALDDSQELVRRSTDALNNGISTMTIVQNTLKDSSADFDAAARDSLRGSMELLDKSLSILDSTTAMRQAGRTMKDTIDNELDKFDTDNRFLFMDPSAEKVSFTSDKNKPPKTLQIVMRTEEISLDDETAKATDAEAAKVKESPLKRMWNVLVQMWKAMVSIFKNR